MTIQRLYPDLKLTRTLTGRLATSGFPVLGIPKHSDEGKKIRSLLVAPSGYLICEVDYSQIELRIAAHLSEDEGMRTVFRTGQDLHAITAHKVLGAPVNKADQDESKHRLPAKAANFGYWMGLQAKGLTEQVHKAGNLEWSADCPGCKKFKTPHAADCDSVRFFQVFNEQFPGAPAYQEARMAHALKTGYAYGMWGMQWYLPGVWSPHDDISEGTKRQAFAIPIQEGAQRLIKQAMRVLYTVDLPKARKDIDVAPILQIHDSLVWCVEEAAGLAWAKQVQQTMESVVTLSVPIIADGKIGPSWTEGVKVK